MNIATLPTLGRDDTFRLTVDMPRGKTASSADGDWDAGVGSSEGIGRTPHAVRWPTQDASSYPTSNDDAGSPMKGEAQSESLNAAAEYVRRLPQEIHAQAATRLQLREAMGLRWADQVSALNTTEEADSSQADVLAGSDSGHAW